jgi:hypothetical protein
MRPWFVAGAVLLASLGCEGYVDSIGARPGNRPGPDLEPPSVVRPGSSSRFPRLTHDEWERTVRDLLRLEAEPGLSRTFRADARTGGALFDNVGGSYVVDSALWSAYQAAAEQLAEDVVSREAALGALLPAGATEDAAGAEAFVREFGGRAYRRPLRPDEVDAYVTLYRAGAGLYGDLDGFRSGVRLVLTAMLQSPYFLYRAELSDQVVDGRIPLTSFERASRLSYALWGTMPDDGLFEAAASGELDTEEGVRAQAERMVRDPRVEARVLDYHEQLLEMERIEGVVVDPAQFPDVPTDLAASAAAELRAFVRDTFRRGGTFRDLLTSNRTFVNADLAGVYGLSGDFPEDELVAVELDPAERAGLFTQVGFLASRSSAGNPDPIYRGVFMAERMNCIHLASPPANVPPVPPIMPDPDGRIPTNREMVRQHTEENLVCAGCHAQVINPFGFPFENYDAVGAFRTEDRYGNVIDAAAEPPVGRIPTPVDDAVEMVRLMADDDGAHACYVESWTQYLLGRGGAEEDAALGEALGPRSRAGELDLRQLLVEIVTSPAFLDRSRD